MKAILWMSGCIVLVPFVLEISYADSSSVRREIDKIHVGQAIAEADGRQIEQWYKNYTTPDFKSLFEAGSQNRQQYVTNAKLNLALLDKDNESYRYSYTITSLTVSGESATESGKKTVLVFKNIFGKQVRAGGVKDVYVAHWVKTRAGWKEHDYKILGDEDFNGKYRSFG